MHNSQLQQMNMAQLDVDVDVQSPKTPQTCQCSPEHSAKHNSYSLLKTLYYLAKRPSLRQCHRCTSKYLHAAPCLEPLMLQFIVPSSYMFCRPLNQDFQANKGDANACCTLALLLMSGCSMSIRRLLALLYDSSSATAFRRA